MEDASLINPYIRVTMHSVLKKGFRMAKRIIYDYELIYIAEGEAVLGYDGTEYKCRKGDFLLLRPGISHSLDCTDTDLSQPHIHFDVTHLPDSARVPVCFKDKDELTEEKLGQIRRDIFKKYPQKPILRFSDEKRALELFYAVLDLQKPCSLAGKGLLIQLLDMLIEDNFPNLFKDGLASDYGVEALVKDYLDAGQGIFCGLDDIARQFSYSKYHLERRFKDRYKIGLIAYRNEKRLQQAKDLLKTASVSETAERTGFSSIYAFSRAFKNRFGISPSKIKNTRTKL